MQGRDKNKSPYLLNDCGDNVQCGYIAHLHLSTAQESNSITLNSALNGTVVDAYFIV